MKRSIIKIFLFFFVVGGLFSSVGFALNGGTWAQTLPGELEALFAARDAKEKGARK